MRSNWVAGAAGAALAVIVIGLLGAGTGLSRAGHRGCHGHGAEGQLGRLEAKLADLELDVETRAAAARVLEQARSERETQREEMRDARRALRELLEAEPPALDEVMAQAEVVGALETDAHKAKLRTMIELRSLLGAEPWQQLEDSLRRHRAEHVEKS